MVDPRRLIERRRILWAVLFLTASEPFAFAIQSKKGPSADRTVSFRYRAAKECDLRAIYDLLHETFDDESERSLTATPWWGGRRLSSQLPIQLPTRANSQSEPLNTPKYQQLQRRWTDLVQNSNVPHTWIVAETKSDSQIAGFMELGSMPSPIAIPISITMLSNPMAISKPNANDNEFNSDQSDQSMTRGYRPDRPFLANLAVAKEYRRQGIGRTLVQLALKISKNKWPSSSSGEERGDDDDTSSLVAASSSWWMYLSVDKDNETARRLYDSLDFSIVLDETQVLSPQRLEELSRPPRLYYGKRL